jgi:hypothetical protein
MKFSEFFLYNSIHDVYLGFERSHLKPRSADWLIYHDKRKQLTDLISKNFEGNTFSEEKILKAWDDFGKNKEKYKLLLSVANTFGRRCFYEHRNKGVCSDTMCIEHLLTSGPNKAENCVIVCKRHAMGR